MGTHFDAFGGQAENADRFRKQMKALVATAASRSKGN
jgi:hypothetical protein